MDTSSVLALVALSGSITLVTQARARLVAIFALVAAGIEVLVAFHVIRLGITSMPLGLILGGILAVCGVILYTRVTSKAAIAASTAITLVGALQVLAAL